MSPVGTTSTCPPKQILGSNLPNLAYKFSTFSVPSPKSTFLQLNPNGSNKEIIRSMDPADFGVILSHLINLDVNSTGFIILDIKIHI